MSDEQPYVGWKEEQDAKATLEAMGIEFAPTPEPTRSVEVMDDWELWQQSIQIKVDRQGQVIIGLALGVVVTLGFSVLMGRVVIKLVQGQKDIIGYLNSTNRPTSDDGVDRSSSGSRYSTPSNRVDTAAAAVDEDLAADLASKIQTSTNVEIPDELK
jgi:hypothetical protein